MNWGQFKDYVSQLFLVGIVVASWSLTQEVAVRTLLMTNIFSNCIQSIQRLKLFVIKIQQIQ